MESIEQELMTMLRRLPIPITITWRSGLYHWQCAQETGSAQSLVSAAEAALVYLLRNAPMQGETGKREKGLNGRGVAQ